MRKHTYPLHLGGPDVLEVAWSGLWRHATVTLAGQVVGTIPSQRALRQGRTFALPDASTLEVRLRTGLLTELQITRNGVPLPGSASHPASRLGLATAAFVLVGLSTLVLGTVTELLDVDLLRDLGVGIESAVCGALLLVLSVLMRTGSPTALGLAVAVFLVDSALALATPEHPNAGVFMMRALLLVPMLRGFDAVRSIQAQRAVDASVDAF